MLVLNILGQELSSQNQKLITMNVRKTKNWKLAY